MDAISDPTIERVVIMASARVGKTEIINNLTGYHIHQDPAPILVVYPTETAAEEWSRDKLAPMLRDSPAVVYPRQLAELLAPVLTAGWDGVTRSIS